MQARDVCEDAKNTQITPVHLFTALCDEATTDITTRLFQKAGVDTSKVKSALKQQLAKLPRQDPPPDSVAPDSSCVKVLRAADALRKKNDDSHIAVDHLIQATITDSNVAKALSDAGVNTSGLLEALKEIRGGRKVTSEQAEAQYDALNKYGGWRDM